jgi:hypothetical protein
MKAADADILIVPGVNGSGPDHWQTRWERKLSTARRVEQADWDSPRPKEWQASLITEVHRGRRPVVLVAHSLGVVTAVQAADQLASRVVGAFLVTPPDVSAPGLPQAWRAFGPLRREPLPFPAFLVLSRSDPYCAFETGEALALAWDALLVDAGEAGHINPDSGHGPWPEGLLIFSRLLRNLGAPQLARSV